jgi:hypothetical protein
MVFDKRAAAQRSSKKDPVFGVGWHAFVHWPHPSLSVPLLGGSESTPPDGLSDGDEVEILSWLPRHRDGMAYQIRRLSDASECWILAVHLRRQRHAGQAVGDADKRSG